jgi:cellulose synthase/poly-beta-1,6-N-acetylglucosamine synthase-like glycosyltransferase
VIAAIAELLCALSAAAIVYILLGYPILLHLMRGRRAPTVRKDLSFEPRVSVILAVYNGASHLRAKLETLFALEYPREKLEIIVVSDGSTDGSETIAGAFVDAGVITLRVPHGGKAAALNAGILRASGDILFFTDVRQPLDRMALRHLVANFADPTVGAATGEMKLMQPGSGEQIAMDLYWRYEIWARARHSEIDSLFTTTGCIYAMRRSLAELIPADTLTDDATLALRAFFRGHRVVFDPAAVAWDYPAVTGTEFRRRMRTLAGLWQIHARFPELFTSRNRMRWHFLSHKFARLILPWALIVFAVSSLALPPGWPRILIWSGELALLVLAELAGVAPPASKIKRACSVARTFLTMNLAALSAVAVFFVPAQRIWKPTVASHETPPAR